jgi:hypothetical protein
MNHPTAHQIELEKGAACGGSTFLEGLRLNLHAGPSLMYTWDSDGVELLFSSSTIVTGSTSRLRPVV